MADVGYATLAVIPSAKGFGSELSRQVNPQMSGAGAVGGQAFGGGMLSAAKKFAAPLAGLFAATAVVGFFKDAAQAAIEDEKSVVALSTAMTNLGLASQNAVAEDFIAGLQRSTGAADDELRPALQKLVTATGDLTQSQKLLSLAQDISAATGRDLASVSQGLARASMGQFSALQRLGIPLDADIIKSKDFAKATEVLSQKFAGQAAAAAATYGGQLKILSTAADEAKESVGYALLDALKSFTGEASNAADAVTALGDGMATWVKDTSDSLHMVVDLGGAVYDLLAPFQSAEGGADGLGKMFEELGGWSFVLKGSLAHLNDTLKLLRGEVDATFGGFQDDALTQFIDKMGIQTPQAAQDAADALDDVTDANDRLTASIANAQARLDFQRWLRDLDSNVAKGSTTLDGFGKAARINQDILIQGFSLAEDKVRRWVASGKISQEEFETSFAGVAKRVVAQFVQDGFDLKDIRRFLKSQGLWTTELAALFNKGKNQSAYDEANRLGMGVGGALGMGVVKGVAGASPYVNAGARQLILEAEAAARAAAESHSPSMLMFRVGEDLGSGLAAGMKSKTGDIAAAGTGAIRDAVKVMMDAARESRDQAMAAIRGVSDSVVGSVLGNINFSTMTTDAEGKSVPLTPAQMVAMILGDVKNQTDAVAAIAANVGAKLPPALLSQIMTMPPDTAIALAKYLGENPALLTQLTTDYEALGTFTTTQLGIPMGLAWAQVGEQSAKNMLAAARELVKARKDTFSAWVGEQLSTTITVGVRFVSSGTDFPGRANGGPVLAGQPYTVGERGRETFVPGVDGTILPHGSLDSATAAQRRDAVAGVGDVSLLVDEIRGLRKEFRDQAERNRTLARSNGYGR